MFLHNGCCETFELLGDYAVKSVGVIAEPEVSELVIQPEDLFLILGSDGVWEFISSQVSMIVCSKLLQHFFNRKQLILSNQSWLNKVRLELVRS